MRTWANAVATTTLPKNGIPGITSTDNVQLHQKTKNRVLLTANGVDNGVWIVAYFNAWRPHRGLGRRAPCGSALTAQSNPTGRIIGQPVLGGLHHVYHHAA